MSKIIKKKIGNLFIRILSKFLLYTFCNQLGLIKKYKIAGIPKEQYLDCSWNKHSEKDYVTKIIIPIKTII